MTSGEINKEFDYQVTNLIRKGYHKAAGLSEEDFTTKLHPLKENMLKLSTHPKDIKNGYLPFIIVINSGLLTVEEVMMRVEKGGKPGFVNLTPHSSQEYRPITGLIIPDGIAYLLTGIDRGKETLNVTPEKALTVITLQKRSPLTINEGLAIITHYPEFLKKNNCFSLLASRTDDKTVPAIWLSDNKPRLGWCWNGNPHTWLGSASCGGRVSL